MAQIICQKHKLPIQNICALNQCQNAFCYECIVQHFKNTGHNISVRLNQRSKEFFIAWNQYMIPRIGEMTSRLKAKGYKAIFEITNKVDNINANINQIEASQINQTALQVLNQQKNILIQNVNFVSSAKNLDDLRVSDFYKNLYNLFINDLAFNMKKITLAIEKKLIQKLPQKKIYKQIQFKFNQRDMKLLEDTKVKLIKVIQKKVILNLDASNQPSLNKSESQSSIKNLQANFSKKYEAIQKLQLKEQQEKILKVNPESPVYKKSYMLPKSQIYSPKSSSNLNLKNNSFSGIQSSNIYKDNFQKQTVQSPKNSGFDPYDPLKKIYFRKSANINPNQANQEQNNYQNIYSKSSAISARFSRSNNNKSDDLKNKFMSPTSRQPQIQKQQQTINPSDKSYRNEKQIRNLKSQINKLKIELQDKNKTVKKIQIQKDQSDKKAFELQKQISSLQNRISQINFSIQNSQSKTQRQLKDAKFETQKQRRQLETKIRSLESSLHYKQNQIQRIQRDNQSNKESLNQKCIFIKELLSNFPIKVKARDNQQQLLKKQIQILLLKQQQLQSKIFKQGQAFSDIEATKRDFQKINQSQNENFKNKIQNLINEKDNLSKKLQEKDRLFEAYKIQKENQIKNLKEQIEQYIKKQQFKFNEKSSSQKSLHSNKSQKIQNLKQTIKDLQSKLFESKQSQDQQNLTSENSLLKSQINEYKAKIIDLQNQLLEGANIDDELLGEMIELDTQIAVRNKDIQILAKTVMQCTKKYSIDIQFLKNKFKGLTTIKLLAN